MTQTFHMVAQHVSSKPLDCSIITEREVSSLDNALLRNSYMNCSTDKVSARSNLLIGSLPLDF